MGNCKHRVYFDYNIIDGLVKNKIREIKNETVDIFYSVAHVEEYYKAEINDKNSTSDNSDSLEKIKTFFLEKCKKGMILNPSEKRVWAKKEKFDDCYNRVKAFDTREIINENGEVIFENNKNTYEKLKEEDPQIVNITNIEPEKIWEEEAVQNSLSTFEQYYKDYEKNTAGQMKKAYGILSPFLGTNKGLPKNFALKKGCFEKEYETFSLLEAVIEFLNDCLCSCGYNKDKKVRSSQSGIHDVSHMIYATYCNCFVTNDKRLLPRARAVYQYLGIDTEVIDYADFEKRFGE